MHTLSIACVTCFFRLSHKLCHKYMCEILKVHLLFVEKLCTVILLFGPRRRRYDRRIKGLMIRRNCLFRELTILVDYKMTREFVDE